MNQTFNVRRELVICKIEKKGEKKKMNGEIVIHINLANLVRDKINPNTLTVDLYKIFDEYAPWDKYCLVNDSLRLLVNRENPNEKISFRIEPGEVGEIFEYAFYDYYQESEMTVFRRSINKLKEILIIIQKIFCIN